MIIFNNATDQLKEAYLQQFARSKYNWDEMTIAHKLYLYYPRFLELESRWIYALLEAGWDIKDDIN